MRTARVLGATVALSAMSLFGPGLVQAANASLSFKPCTTGSEIECATLVAPANRALAEKPTIDIHVERVKATSGGEPTPSAVLALAGGPGQPALPFVQGFRELMAPALKTRDLIVIDQRGTGTSGPLHCAAAEGKGTGNGVQQFEQCEKESHEQGSFTSAESVADMWQLLQETGYSKFMLYGTSYGTKVALNYAEAHPEGVESMVLDSVVRPEGEDPLHVASFRAVRGMLDELCRGRCRFAPHPVADTASFDRRWSGTALRGSFITGRGVRIPLALESPELWSLFLAGDLNPVLRAMLPGAVHAALHGDAQPLMHLWAMAAGLIPSSRPGEKRSPEVNTVLFYTTLCEDSSFPWNNASSFNKRREEALEFTAGLPEASFYPFDAGTAFEEGDISFCAAWRSASSGAVEGGKLPDVPALIVSGGQDLRTPTADARAVAAKLPQSQVLVVPYVGHSAIGADLSGCTAKAVQQFFAGSAVSKCTSTRRVIPPAPAPASTRAIAGRTLAAKSLQAAIASLNQLRYDESAAAFAGTLWTGAAFGGVRGGYAVVGSQTTLHSYSDVPAVAFTGKLRKFLGKLTVSGRNAAHGTLTLTKTRIYGKLGGRRVSAAMPGSSAIITATAGAARLPLAPRHPVFP